MKKQICIVLALGIALVLASCGKSGTPAAVPEITTAQAIKATAEPEPTTESTEEITTDEEITEIEETEYKKPGTVAEIVAFYNDAANRVKTELPGYSFTEQTRINSVFGGAEWMMNMLSDAINRDTPQAATVKKGESHKDFAIPGKDWASMLAADMVQSASCTEKGGLYEIRINMKTEARPDLPSNVEEHNHGRVFKIYNRGMIYGAMSGYESLAKMEKFAPTYHDCYLVCTVDKDGSMKSAQYYLTFGAEIEMKLTSFIPLRASADISVTGKYVF